MQGVPERRVLAELRALLERFPSLRRAPAADGALVFEVSLEIDGETRHVRLTLPPAYPEVPPEVRELAEPGGAAIVPMGGMHRFSNGVVCLFAHGNDPQVWRQDRLAVEALVRFVALVRLEKGEAGRGGGRLFRDSRRIHVPPAIASVMLLPGGRGTVRLRLARSGEGDLQADAIRFEAHPELDFMVESNAAWADALPGERWAPWIHAAFEGRPWCAVGADRATLDASLRGALPVAVHRRMAGEELLVLARGRGERLDDCDAVHFRRPATELGTLYVNEVEISDLPTRLFRRNAGVIRGREWSSKTRVVMVGLGSLGGAVALALARAGIERFVLVDPDSVSLENVCRHVAPISLVGLPKVAAVELMLRGINPDVRVTAIPKHLAWDLPHLGAGKEVAAMLTAGDVVVCTCAVGPAERQLNALAVRRGVPVIFGAALGAAEYARVFRVIAGESACYECLMRAQDRDPERFPRFVAEGAPEEGAAYMDPSLPGLAIDVTQIAMLIARLTLQTIARTIRADIGMADERGHHLLWSNRGGWADCDRSLQVAVRDVPRDPECPVCGEGVEEAAMSESEAAELAALRAKVGG